MLRVYKNNNLTLLEGSVASGKTCELLKQKEMGIIKDAESTLLITDEKNYMSDFPNREFLSAILNKKQSEILNGFRFAKRVIYKNITKDELVSYVMENKIDTIIFENIGGISFIGEFKELLAQNVNVLKTESDSMSSMRFAFDLTKMRDTLNVYVTIVNHEEIFEEDNIPYGQKIIDYFM